MLVASLLVAVGLVAGVIAEPDPREYLFKNSLAKRATIDHLGRRDTSQNGLTYPEPGIQIPKNVPQIWLDKLKQVTAAGKIPKVPVAVANQQTGLTTYPGGVSASSVCSWTNTQCWPKTAIVDAPEKLLGLALDDGPVTAVLEGLHPIVRSHNASMSHFLIGSQVLWDLPAFHKLLKMEPPQHIALHTFTHTMMTTHTNEEIVADLGWAMQITYDYGGILPLYWRAPSGDTDTRVYAIAKEVFGLQLVGWNQDSFDWCILNDGSTYKADPCKDITRPSIKSNFVRWAKDGDGIIPLIHEARVSSVELIHSLIEAASDQGYTYGPIPFLQNLPWYGNSDSATSTPQQQKNVLPTKAPFDVPDEGAKKDGVQLKSPWRNVKTVGTLGHPGMHGDDDDDVSGGSASSSKNASIHTPSMPSSSSHDMNMSYPAHAVGNTTSTSNSTGTNVTIPTNGAKTAMQSLPLQTYGTASIVLFLTSGVLALATLTGI